MVNTVGKPYSCSEKLCNAHCPQKILPLVFSLVDVRSAIDVGCGLGTWTQVLVDMGVEDVCAMDGEWYDPDILSRHIDLGKFIVHDLNKGMYHGERRFDLAICLEVAEHVDPLNENNVVDTLTGLSDVILFSAAIPGQGGKGHVNEQWPSHWQRLFREQGYDFADVVRPCIWTDRQIYKWYRQNVFIVAKSDLLPDIYARFHSLNIENKMLDVVHPEYWNRH